MTNHQCSTTGRDHSYRFRQNWWLHLNSRCRLQLCQRILRNCLHFGVEIQAHFCLQANMHHTFTKWLMTQNANNSPLRQWRAFALHLWQVKSQLCKNGWTDRDAVWVEDSGGPKEPSLEGSKSPGEGALLSGIRCNNEPRNNGWMLSSRTTQSELMESSCCLQ